MASETETHIWKIEAGPVIDFLQQAFGGEEVFRSESGGVVHHASVKIGSSVVSMGEAHGEFQPRSCMFYLYVEDTDSLYRRALASGASSISEPVDQAYGDRNAAIRDPFGNEWYIATHIRDFQS